jgi:hypothetical protein
MQQYPYGHKLTKNKILPFKPAPISNPVIPIRQVPADQPDNMGLNVPFRTFSWVDWQQIQTTIICALSRFQRAIEHNQPADAINAVEEIGLTLRFLHAEAHHHLDQPGH